MSYDYNFQLRRRKGVKNAPKKEGKETTPKLSYMIVNGYQSYNVWVLVSFTVIFIGLFLLAFLLPRHIESSNSSRLSARDYHLQPVKHYTTRFYYERDYPSYTIEERSTSPELSWHTILNSIQSNEENSPGYLFYASCASNRFSRQLSAHKNALRSSIDIKDRINPVFIIIPDENHKYDSVREKSPLLAPSLPILQYCEDFTYEWPSIPSQIPAECVDQLITLVEVAYPSLSSHKQSNIHLQVKAFLQEVVDIFHAYQSHIPLWDFGSYVEELRVTNNNYRVVSTASSKIENLTSSPRWNMAWYYVKILHTELATNRRFIHQPMPQKELRNYFTGETAEFPRSYWLLRPVWNCLDLTSIYVPLGEEEGGVIEFKKGDHFVDYIFSLVNK